MLDENGEVMSKSKGNVISPEDMIAGYGADAVRAYILFMAPPDKELQWNEDGLAGMYKFLNRAWRMVNDLAGKAGEETSFQAGAKAEEAKKAHDELLRERHRVVGKVIDDFARNNFNTAIAAIMELVNATGDYLRKNSAEDRAANAELAAFDKEVAEVIVKLLAPMAPPIGPKSCGRMFWATKLPCTRKLGPSSTRMPLRLPRLSWQCRLTAR